MDVIYMSRPGQRHEELRHSLRSVEANLPEAKVWVAGHLPRWCSDSVLHIPARHDPIADKFTNARSVLVAAMAADGPSERVILMHDDMFITEPMTDIPVLHRGSGAGFERYLNTHHAPSSYSSAAAHTHRWLERQGIPADEVYSYSLHVPMPMVRADVLAAIGRLPRSRYPWHLRTVYGCLAGIGGEEVDRDCKVYRMNGTRVTGPPSYPYPFVSTSDRTFASGGIGHWLRSRFSQPCRYETPTK